MGEDEDGVEIIGNRNNIEIEFITDSANVLYFPKPSHKTVKDKHGIISLK